MRALLVLLVGCGFSAPTGGSVIQDGPEGGEMIVMNEGGMMASCFGSGAFQVCPVAAPTGERTLPAGTIDTGSGGPMCEPLMMTVMNVCLISGATIEVTGAVRATGGRPLVLLATTTIIIRSAGSIDVASHRTIAGVGAAGDASCNAGVPATGNSGGYGGSFRGRGGIGGANGGNGGIPPQTAAASSLRGGCPGSDGAGSANSRGHGGGAVLLIAGTSITVETNAFINASGAGATGAGSNDGGGGGGSGGMIALHAPMVLGAGALVASGGGGGEGDGGNDGSDPSMTAPMLAAPGGTGNGGGDGGAGSTTGDGGLGGLTGGGGGGGGGGAGAILKLTGSTTGFTGAVMPPFSS